jgi:hypothetical protein
MFLQHTHVEITQHKDELVQNKQDKHCHCSGNNVDVKII